MSTISPAPQPSDRTAPRAASPAAAIEGRWSARRRRHAKRVWIAGLQTSDDRQFRDIGTASPQIAPASRVDDERDRLLACGF